MVSLTVVNKAWKLGLYLLKSFEIPGWRGCIMKDETEVEVPGLGQSEVRAKTASPR